MKLILASTSVYRQALLSRLGFPFTSKAPQVDEDQYKGKGLSLVELTRKLAELKASAISKDDSNAVVIGSDQALGFEDQIFSKPLHFDKAKSQLKLLQGREHQLVTSVCIMSSTQKEIFHNITTLKMKALTDTQIETYLNLDKPFDCAGSYKLEEHGIALFESIESLDFNSIVGLPLLQTSQILEKQFGFIPFTSQYQS